MLEQQIYTENFTCPSLSKHPFRPMFIAQTAANYIACFKGQKPFRMKKDTRFVGQFVGANPVRCRFCRLGKYVLSGSADGNAFIFDAKTTRLVQAKAICVTMVESEGSCGGVQRCGDKLYGTQRGDVFLG